MNVRSVVKRGLTYVLILVRNSFSVLRHDDLELASESLWIELMTHDRYPLLLGVLYRPPSTDNSVLDQLYSVLNSLNVM